MNIRRLAYLLAIAAFLATDVAIAQEEALGRLFYTPQQRAALNANIRSETKQPQKRIPVPRAVTLSGVVTRSDGERTVWVDGRAYHKGDPKDVRVLTDSSDPASAQMEVRGIRKRMPVRVGQQLDPSSGNTSEIYEEPRPVARERQQRPAKHGSGAETASSHPD